MTDQLSLNGATGAGPTRTFRARGREYDLERAERWLAIYNEAAGSRIGARNGKGEPSTVLKRAAMRAAEFADATDEEVRALAARYVEAPWSGRPEARLFFAGPANGRGPEAEGPFERALRELREAGVEDESPWSKSMARYRKARGL